ncbi:MAG: hypothetical protein RL021_2016 [Bacteroidota bacterium]
MIHRIFILSFLTVSLALSRAEGQQVTVRWEADFHQTLKSNEPVVGPDPYRVEVLKFYVSGLSLYKGDRQVFSEPSPLLIDLTDSARTTPLLSAVSGDFDRVDFQLGIDSTTNAQGVLGGDLDPTNGMYWTWQSGYINFKLEASSRQIGGQKGLQYHLGGYRQPFNALRTVSLKVDGPNAVIVFNSRSFLTSLPANLPDKIMSPGLEACTVADHAADAFKTHRP